MTLNKAFFELSLTCTTVKPDDIHVCHRMKNKEKVIIKFKDNKIWGSS